MDFEQIKYFVSNKMRMSHIYQPVVIRSLLINNGVLHDIDIAKYLVCFDPSQIEYYQNITNNMVGKVLRNHNIVRKQKSEYFLNGFNNLNQTEIEILVNLCDEKISGFIAKRGDSIWEHRRKNRGYISGTTKYNVLRRAEFRCELCGISASEKALEVDHIDPVALGGVDDETNYQALCYSCNAMKRDKDNTDLRANSSKYNYREDDCVFCNMEESRILDEDHLFYAIRDLYPVSELHTLIIPKRHSLNYFDLNQAEINSSTRLIKKHQKFMSTNDPSIVGFNIGMNCGITAGQTVMHTHIHLIPRRIGDVEKARGGIRNIIPGKGNY
ncbi:MAG: HIT domain-containing protein [Chitinophagaceae bacterium]|nr:MAG: HIT domain-containing protein [Chitinophagaceae bacterium]